MLEAFDAAESEAKDAILSVVLARVNCSRRSPAAAMTSAGNTVPSLPGSERGDMRRIRGETGGEMAAIGVWTGL